MTLYEMLDKTKYYQEVWIFENNIFDQNMPIFKGTVQEARSDADMTWDYLMCEVELYDCTTGILDIRVRNEYYNERLEVNYSIASRKWGAERGERPWLWSAEIDADLRESIKALSSPQSEIIRCKDCKHRYIKNDVWTCPFGLPSGPDGYCSYGEIKEERK